MSNILFLNGPTSSGKSSLTKRFQLVSDNAEQNMSLVAAKKSRNKETLQRDVQQMLSKRKLKSLLHVTITPIEVNVAKKDSSPHLKQLAESLKKA